jgi:hypothetical protein
MFEAHFFHSGSVELENLPLRKDALRHWGLPFKIKAGFIGKVKLNIPITRLRSSPWVISMEQLYVIVSPLHPEEVPFLYFSELLAWYSQFTRLHLDFFFVVRPGSRGRVRSRKETGDVGRRGGELASRVGRKSWWDPVRFYVRLLPIRKWDSHG